MEPYTFKPKTCKKNTDLLSTSMKNKKKRVSSNLYLKTEPDYDVNHFIDKQKKIKAQALDEEPRNALNLSVPAVIESHPHHTTDLHTIDHKDKKKPKMERMNTTEFDQKVSEKKKLEDALRKEARKFLLEDKAQFIPESEFDR